MQLFLEQHYRKVLLLIWVVSCLMLAGSTWSAIAEWRMGDPDDQMRLIQVRDWLAGQSWWDVTQYRMNIPEGGPMHWSRLVDVPIAAAILVLTPVFGMALAEHATLAVIPLLTFGVILYLYAATACGGSGAPHADRPSWMATCALFCGKPQSVQSAIAHSRRRNNRRRTCALD
jgi:hypothetical protein